MSLSKGLGAWALTPIGGVTVAVVVAVTATGGYMLTGSAKASFSISISPASQSAPQGQSASYTIAMQGQNGFSSPVSLAASGLPAGATASFSPTSITKSGGTATMTVALASDASPLGSTNFRVTGSSSGYADQLASATINVTPFTSPPFSLSATPGSTQLLPGDTATYTVAVNSATAGGAPVALSVVSGLPSGATASFSPASAAVGSASTLTVTTKNNSPTGNYTLIVGGSRAGQPQQTTTVAMNLSATGRAFGITSASFTDMAPGVSHALDLSLSNPNSQALTVTNITVTVQAVSKASNAPAGPCTTDDFVVKQYGGAYPLTNTVGARASQTLSQLGVAASQLPTISMPNSSTRNQNGCIGATVTLAFSGSGQG